VAFGRRLVSMAMRRNSIVNRSEVAKRVIVPCDYMVYCVGVLTTTEVADTLVPL
jgi:hypothetical protein